MSMLPLAGQWIPEKGLYLDSQVYIVATSPEQRDIQKSATSSSGR